VREPSGRPILRFSGVAADFAERLGMKRALVSITHTAAQAIAQVILEQ
jgi:phosphopantetheinyl transferase (holo-ACP synthase)